MIPAAHTSITHTNDTARELLAGHLDWTYVTARTVVEFADFVRLVASDRGLDVAGSSATFEFLGRYARSWTTPSIGDIVEYVETWYGDEKLHARRSIADTIGTVLVCAIYGVLDY